MVWEVVLRKFVDHYAFLLGLAGLVIGLDQYTKWLVVSNLTMGETWMPWMALVRYARIVNWHNTGAAFGMFQNGNLVFSIIAVIVSILILYYFPQVPKAEWTIRIAMSLQLGGAIGNLIDRVRQGYVTDFISLGAFPVFNIADSSISVGVAVLLLGVWLKEHLQRRDGQVSLDSSKSEAQFLPPEQQQPLEE